MKQQSDILPSIDSIGELGAICKRPEPNLVLIMGEGMENITFYLFAKRTLGNRLKWWLFCKFFPFKITHWNEENDKSYP